MSTSPPAVTVCPACGTPIEADGACPRCHAADDQETLEAVDYVVRRFEEWHKAGDLTHDQWKSLSERYARQRQLLASGDLSGPHLDLPPRDRCWSCKETVHTGASHCDACGAPAQGPAVKSLRFCRCLSRELDALERSGGISLRQAHTFVGETQERIAALKRKLENDRALAVTLVPGETVRVTPRRSVMEVLLDPRSIQWLLATGGGLLVLGLVIWLGSLGLFDNPGVVATCLGIANAGVLAGGLTLTLRTRYQFAGKALTLLACLVMPLNLWFYHAHNLMTLEGHLWTAALVCCVVYAVSAYVLQDPLFVYVLVAGVTLTGILLLGDIHRLDEIAAPVTLLMVLGLACLHAERAFPPDDASPFSRRRFGMAFYWSSLALISSGLVVLLVAQLIGWLHDPLLRHIGFGKPAVAERAYLPWTIALVLAGTYALVYADVVVRRIGVYLYLAAVTLLWAEIQMLVLLDFAGSEAIVIVTLALTALAVNVLQVQFAEKRAYLRTIPPLGVLLSLVPLALGILLHLRATNRIWNELWPYPIDWKLVGAMLVTALTCRVAAHLYRRSIPGLAMFYFFATACATLLFAAELLWVLDVKDWQIAALPLMLIPIAYVIAAHLYRGHSPSAPLLWCAHASTAIMIACSLYVAAGIVPQVAEIVPVTGQTLNLLLAAFCLEAAVFYGLAAALHKAGWNIYLATAMLCGAVCELLYYFDMPTEVYAVAFTTLGVALLVAYRFAVLEQVQWAGLARAGFQSANALTLLGFAAGALRSLRLLTSLAAVVLLEDAADWRHPVQIGLYLMLFQAAMSLLAAWLVRHGTWRRAYLVLAVANVGLAALLFHRLHPLNPWQTLEVISILLGAGLLAIGHVGWYRESDERLSDAVSLALLFGSAAVVVPLGIATVVHRFGYEISPVNELGLVLACVVLFGSGILCRLKAPTLFGSITMGLYILMVLIYMHRFLKEQVLVGIYLTLGGALLFGTGLVLSVYRDRLLALPDRIKRREGVFRVFGWR